MVTKSISSELEKTKDLSVNNYETVNPNESKTPQLCGWGQSNQVWTKIPQVARIDGRSGRQKMQRIPLIKRTM